MHPAYHTGTHLFQSSAPPLTGDSTCTSSLMPHVMYTLTPFPMSPSVPTLSLSCQSPMNLPFSISHESSSVECIPLTSLSLSPMETKTTQSLTLTPCKSIPYKDYQQVHIMSLFSDPQSSQSAMPTPPSSSSPAPSLLLDSQPQTPTPPSSRQSTPCLTDSHPQTCTPPRQSKPCLTESQPQTPTPPSSRESTPCLTDSQPPTPTPPSSWESTPCLTDSQPQTSTPPSSRQSTPCLTESQPQTPTPPSSRESTPCLTDSQPQTPTPPSSRESTPCLSQDMNIKLIIGDN